MGETGDLEQKKLFPPPLSRKLRRDFGRPSPLRAVTYAASVWSAHFALLKSDTAPVRTALHLCTAVVPFLFLPCEKEYDVQCSPPPIEKGALDGGVVPPQWYIQLLLRLVERSRGEGGGSQTHLTISPPAWVAQGLGEKEKEREHMWSRGTADCLFQLFFGTKRSRHTI